MVREGVSVTWSVLSWSGGREFEPQSGSNLGCVVLLSQVVLELNISSLKVLKHALLKEAWISRFFTALLNFNDFSGLHPMKANKPETNGGWESIYIKLPDFSAEVHHTTRCEDIWSTLATLHWNDLTMLCWKKLRYQDFYCIVEVSAWRSLSARMQANKPVDGNPLYIYSKKENPKPHSETHPKYLFLLFVNLCYTLPSARLLLS